MWPFAVIYGHQIIVRNVGDRALVWAQNRALIQAQNWALVRALIRAQPPPGNSRAGKRPDREPDRELGREPGGALR